MRCTEKCASHFDQHIPGDGRWRQSTARRENTAVIAPESGAYFAVTNETFLGGTAPGFFPGAADWSRQAAVLAALPPAAAEAIFSSAWSMVNEAAF